MDNDPFTDRVNKTFGSLLTSLEPSSSRSNPLWSLTGAEVEKREWRRDKDTSDRDSNPCSSSFDDFLYCARKNSRRNIRNHRKEVDDGGDEDGDEEEEGEDGIGDGGLNDWDVRSSIGLDSTLDNEEEEDTFDKVAIGRENAGDRLYMKDITGNHDSNSAPRDDLPNTIGDKQRDPRANRWAARIRLKEDDAEAAAQTEQHKGGRAPPAKAEKEYNDKVKPILKRKEHESISKPSKRVRFDPGCIISEGGGSDETIRNQNNGKLLDEKVSRVPDYVRHPSKYKCYSFDSTDTVSDKSNTGAFLDLLEIVKRSKNGGSGSDLADASVDLPKSITFIPKKKSDTAKSDGGDPSESTQDRESHMKPSLLQSTSLGGGISAGEDQESEFGDMEIDEPEVNDGHDRGITFKKHGRQYRSKPRMDSQA